MSNGREREIMTQSQVRAILPPDVGCGFVASSAWDRLAATAIERRAARQAEFRCGRQCALRALQQVGWRPEELEPTAAEDSSHESATEEVVGVGPDRRPLWPAGFTGSLSHSRHWTWAVAARQSDYRGIGIDTEAIIEAQTAAELQTEIGRADEWERLARTRLPMPLLVTLLWSAKEAYFKLWFPLHERFLTGMDVRLYEIVDDGPQLEPPVFAVTEGRIRLLLGPNAEGGAGTGALCPAMERTTVVALWTSADLFAVAAEPAGSGPRFHGPGDGVA